MDCRKHCHEINQAVCPSCLREKLFNLSIAKNHIAVANINNSSNSSYSDILSSENSSGSSSSPAGDFSPARKPAPFWHNRAGSMSQAVGKRQNDEIDDGLKKSKSMAFVSGGNNRLVGKIGNRKREKKIKKGLWSKLVVLKNDMKDGFMYSRGLKKI